MTINNAVRLAMLAGLRIKRMDDLSGCELEPTNTDDCIIIHGPDGMVPCVRWNPSAEDLMSECWGVLVPTPDGTVKPFWG